MQNDSSEVNAMSTRRKLAAVLFADIAGFTQQVSADEVKGLERRRRVEELVKSSAASHSGRVVKTIGDAVMLEFGSACMKQRRRAAFASRGRSTFRFAQGAELLR
jgi:adenylate cyclase